MTAHEKEDATGPKALEPTTDTTSFLGLIRLFKLSKLIRGGDNVAVVPLTLLVMIFVAVNDVAQSSLQNIATAYLVAAAALFGVVIVGLSVLAAFVAGRTLDAINRAFPEVLLKTYAAFYWVAALSVASIICTVGLILTTSVTNGLVAWTIGAGVATAVFLKTMFGSLWLVGRVIRLAVYGPTFAQVDQPDDTRPSASCARAEPSS